MINIKSALLPILTVAVLGVALPAYAQQQPPAQPAAAANPGGLANAFSATPAVRFNTVRPGQRYYDYSHANSNAQGVVDNFNQKLAAVQLAILEGMRLQTGQLSGNLREQVGAGHTLADQQDDRSTVRAAEQTRIDAFKSAQSTPSACRTISGTRSADSSAAAQAYRAQTSGEIADFYSGNAGPSTRGRDFAIQARAEALCNYVTQTEIDNGICTDEEPVNLAGADRKASETIFHRELQGPAGLNEERHAAALAFVTHVTAARPLERLAQNEFQSEAGRARAAMNATIASSASIAQDSLNALVEYRYISDSVGGQDKQWAAGVARNMPGFDPAKWGQGISERDWLELQSKMYILDRNLIEAANTDEVTAIKDIRNMTAVGLYQNFRQLEMMELAVANLATMLAMMTDDKAAAN